MGLNFNFWPKHLSQAALSYQVYWPCWIFKIFFLISLVVCLHLLPHLQNEGQDTSWLLPWGTPPAHQGDPSPACHTKVQITRKLLMLGAVPDMQRADKEVICPTCTHWWRWTSSGCSLGTPCISPSVWWWFKYSLSLMAYRLVWGF